MRIAILTSGRFYVCDLARELAALGHDVKFYSLVPPWRTRQFGLPKECNRWLLPRVAWQAARVKLSRGQINTERASQKLVLALDQAAASALEPCDVFIGMSGMSNRVGLVAKEKYDAKLWIDRGSRHILSQKQILSSIPGAQQVTDFAVERELTDYEQADTVAVLTKHCEESFLERGFPAKKLVRNPMGVDLKVFQPTLVPPNSTPTVIMTGTWSLRKGCDTLVNAWRKLKGVRLMHVGPVGDYALPNDEGFTHVDKVDQSRLVKYYSQAHVFAIASHEEGLATVQPQALACGLRLVCTTRTGGEDLIPYTADADIISVVEPGNVEAFAEALSRAVDSSLQESGLRDRLLPEARAELSWQGYGRRYASALQNRA